MNKKKNLIIFFPSFEKGGVANILQNLLTSQYSQKFNIQIISSKNLLNTISLKKNINFYPVITKINIPFFPPRFISALNGMFVLTSILNKLSGQILVHSMQSNVAAIIACLIKSKKIVIRNSENPVYSTIHTENIFFGWLAFFLKLLFYNFSDGIITNSKRSKKSLEKITFKNKSKLIYNPYLKKINIEKKISRQNIILSVGRFCKQKNQIVAIKAFANFLKKFPNYKLVIIGDGKDKIKLRNICIDLKINNKVKFEGWVSDPSKYYLRSKILLFPSLYEGLPNTLIDAVNFNLPCISSNCSGAKDILLKDSRIFSPSYNYEILSKKIEFMILEYRKILNQNKILKKNLSKFLITNQVTEYVNYCNFVINRSI